MSKERFKFSNTVMSKEIFKFSNIDELYYMPLNEEIERKIFLEFIELNRETIDSQLLILENIYNKFYKYLSSFTYLDNFYFRYLCEYSLFNVVFNISKKPRISFVDAFDNYILEKDWLTEENIRDILEKNYDSILRKIPISISLLPEIYREIIEDNSKDIKYKGSINVKTKRRDD